MATTNKDPWQAFTLKDAYKPRESKKYVIDGVIEKGSLNIVYGPPATMKSMFLADMAVCVASKDKDFLPHADFLENSSEPLKVNHCPVIWIDLDNGKRRTHARFEALGRARELPPNVPLTYYSMPTPMLDASSGKHMEALAYRMKAQKTGLLIIDNLGIVKGSAKENDDSMTPVMSRFRQLADETGAAIIIIHHQRKGGNGDGRAGESLRGFSSIEAALDYAFLIERDGDVVKFTSTKTRDDDIVPFGAKFTYTQKDNRDLETAMFYGLAIEDKRPEVAAKKAIREALTFKPDGTLESAIEASIGIKLNKRQLLEAVNKTSGIGKNKIGTVIDSMEDLGELIVTPGERRNEKLYSLPD
jgi:RecA-family ATPase